MDIRTRENLKRVLSFAQFSSLLGAVGVAITIAAAVVPDRQTVLLLSAVVILVCSTIVLVWARLTRFAIDLIEVANREVARGAPLRALTVLEEAEVNARSEEERKIVLMEKGHVYRRLRRSEDAIRMYRLSIAGPIYEWQWTAHRGLAEVIAGAEDPNSRGALEAFKEAFEVRSKFQLPTDKDDLRLCQRIGTILSHMGETREANRWFFTEMAVRQQLLNMNVWNESEALRIAAQDCEQAGNILGAIDKLKQAVELLRPALTDANLQTAQLHAEIGRLYSQRVDTADSHDQGWFHYAFVIASRVRYLDSPETVNQDFFERSSTLLNHFSKMCLEKGGEHFWAAMALRQSGRYEGIEKQSALRQLNIALELQEHLFGSDSLAYAETCRRLALVHKFLNLATVAQGVSEEMQTARHLLDKTKRTWKIHHVDNVSPSKFANLLVDLGGTYHIEGNYERAVVERTEALRVIATSNAAPKEVAEIEKSLRSSYEKLDVSKSVRFVDWLRQRGFVPTTED